MTKKLQNKKGFTLTELIVVIVIIGILAAVLIPTLTGYIKKAKISAAEQEAQAYVTAYNSWLVEKDLDEYEGKTFIDYCDSLELTVLESGAETEDTTDDVYLLTSVENGFKFKSNGYIVTYTHGSGFSTVAE